MRINATTFDVMGSTGGGAVDHAAEPSPNAVAVETRRAAVRRLTAGGYAVLVLVASAAGCDSPTYSRQGVFTASGGAIGSGSGGGW